MTTRRDFLKNLTLIGAVAASSSPATALPPAGKKFKPAIQLYSVRDAVAIDLRGTLQKLSEIGFTQLEPYGFNGQFFSIEAREFRKICEDLGMKIVSTHCGITAENAAEYAGKAAEAGLKYIILPSFYGRPENSLDDFKKAAEEMNRIGEITKKTGLSFGYHNHDFEFRAKEGKLPYDLLLAETDPELVSFQMDLFWVIRGGQDPMAYFENHPGRFSTWHIKDMGNDGETCIIGNGRIPFKKLLKKASDAGLQEIVYEQEQYSEGTSLYCAGESLKYIKKHLL